MLRRLKWILVLVVVVVVAGAGIAILTTRPGLSDARDKVDGRWVDLRSTLVRPLHRARRRSSRPSWPPAAPTGP